VENVKENAEMTVDAKRERIIYRCRSGCATFIKDERRREAVRRQGAHI